MSADLPSGAGIAGVLSRVMRVREVHIELREGRRCRSRGHKVGSGGMTVDQDAVVAAQLDATDGTVAWPRAWPLGAAWNGAASSSPQRRCERSLRHQGGSRSAQSLGEVVRARVCAIRGQSEPYADARGHTTAGAYGLGGSRRHRQDYMCLGTMTLVAAPSDVGRCTVQVQRKQCGRHHEFVHLLWRIEASVPVQMDVRFTGGHYATQRCGRARIWLMRRPRVHPHFNPTCRSWQS